MNLEAWPRLCRVRFLHMSDLVSVENDMPKLPIFVIQASRFKYTRKWALETLSVLFIRLLFRARSQLSVPVYRWSFFGWGLSVADSCCQHQLWKPLLLLSCMSTLSDLAKLPPIKTVGSTIRHRKCYLSNYVLLMCTPTTTLNLPLE